MGKVKDFDRYYVSLCGCVLDLKTNRILRKRLIDRYYGYTMANNNGIFKTKYVHRLIAEAFINRDSEDLVVNHINGIRTDNSVQNLEWISQKENILKSWKMGLSKWSPNSGKKVKRCMVNGFIYENATEASLKTGICQPTISKICNNPNFSKTHTAKYL